MEKIMFQHIHNSQAVRPANANVDSTFIELVMRTNPNLVFVKDRASRFVYANRAMMELFAPERRSKVIGYTTVEDFSPSEAAVFLEEDQRAFRDGHSDLVEEIVDYQSYRKTFMVHKMTFCSIKGESLLLGIGTDITDLAKRERALVESNAMLENFAALVAHDLRTPLSSFSGYLSLILYDKRNILTPAATKYIAMMQDSLINLSGEMDGILSVYKARNRNKVDFCNTDLNILFEEAKFNLGNTISLNRASILANRLPILAIDQNLFRHLLMNFFENSIKYRSDKDPVIIFRYAKVGDEHIFSVEDNGIGITKEDEKSIFQMFGQSGKKEAGGIGIGLALCRSIIEMHGGKIWIDHSFKSGCRVCFTIQQPH
jgi:signal transduction histidine kinase